MILTRQTGGGGGVNTQKGLKSWTGLVHVKTCRLSPLCGYSRALKSGHVIIEGNKSTVTNEYGASKLCSHLGHR